MHLVEAVVCVPCVAPVWVAVLVAGAAKVRCPFVEACLRGGTDTVVRILFVGPQASVPSPAFGLGVVVAVVVVVALAALPVAPLVGFVMALVALLVALSVAVLSRIAPGVDGGSIE